MQMQPFMRTDSLKHDDDSIAVSEDIFTRGLCLPSDTNMTEEQQDKVISIIKKICFNASINL